MQKTKDTLTEGITPEKANQTAGAVIPAGQARDVSNRNSAGSQDRNRGETPLYLISLV